MGEQIFLTRWMKEALPLLADKIYSDYAKQGKIILRFPEDELEIIKLEKFGTMSKEDCRKSVSQSRLVKNFLAYDSPVKDATDIRTLEAIDRSLKLLSPLKSSMRLSLSEIDPDKTPGC